MGEELKFTSGNRYSIALLIFFVPYFLFEIPSNIILRRVGAARWLSFLSFGWGMSVLGTLIFMRVSLTAHKFARGNTEGDLCAFKVLVLHTIGQ